jgi:hypothetical protein
MASLPEIPEINDPLVTPAQQNLMNFLDKLATSSYSPELMDEGYRALDEAVQENQRLQDSISQASKVISRVNRGID